MKKRIWELDAFRGICILGMLFVHVLFDLLVFGLWEPPDWVVTLYVYLSEWGGVLFFLISGICVTLGSHPVRRGLMVFGAGMLCTLVTAGMYLGDIMGKFIIIYFGVLHCLGVCMLLWPLFKKLPVWSLGLLAVAFIVLGFAIKPLRIDGYWGIPFGVLPRVFISSDYFPIFPNLGYFLTGTVLGLTLYRKKATLFPRVNPRNPVIRFFDLFGKHSLPIYLLHQPLIYGLIYAYAIWRY